MLQTHLCQDSLEQECENDGDADGSPEQVHIEVLHILDCGTEGIGEAEH